MSPTAARHKTAISRLGLSRPIATAIADRVIATGMTVFDYGCGRGDDVRHLRTLGYQVDGWDPAHRPDAPRTRAEAVNLGYVINVIEDPAERHRTIKAAWDLANTVLIVTARMKWEARDLAGLPMADGMVTRTGTFQKFYEQTELATVIEEATGCAPQAAAPGIFYVFRDPAMAQSFLASRVYVYRPRITINPQQRYEANREALEPLLAFMNCHARPPRPAELDSSSRDQIVERLGSVGRATRLVREVTDDSYWEEVQTRRSGELLIYVALSRFGRRPRFSQLDMSLAGDIRALFGTYAEACHRADKLLLACGDQSAVYLSARSSRIGKQTPSSLYVHRSAVAELPPLLQVYEGCARVLSGTVPNANMVKLSVTEPQVSFLSYPDFDANPHPTLKAAVTVNLRKLTVEVRDYSRSDNPPLLHRKEEFLGRDDPRRPKYARLTASEKRAGLYEHPERIGTLLGWEATLRDCGVTIRGHRLVRRES